MAAEGAAEHDDEAHAGPDLDPEAAGGAHSEGDRQQDAAAPSGRAPDGSGRRSIMDRLKAAAKALKHEVLAVYYAMDDPQTPWLARVLAFLVVAYALSPLDLIPDFIPVLGIIDDLVLLPLMIWATIWLLPKGVMQAARRRAREEPVRLGRNWFLACLIAAGWIGCLEWALWFGVRRWGSPWLVAHLAWELAALGAVCTLAFGVWLAHRVRKEARKAAKAAAKAAQAQAQAQAEAEAEAGAEAGPDVVVVVEAGDELEAGAEDEVQGSAAAVSDDDLRQPLLS
ncbi:hypothetical protein HYH03_002367 [Edaphochlamys debaryana]|uniref:DUF1232 domain-containing protein n=1 Tax=Edaphochlamys debaryana TaxID=47281 RepID=A0A836C426_9CHLO|nr:hypothetical protein HYH03_002367 [Edaphochlamys debaryana]|eukprot:KAG2499420.1 hypothetical protein HYH03_002367 [Edaphochlamys debaryana]